MPADWWSGSSSGDYACLKVILQGRLIGAGTARMLTERDDAGVRLKADPLLECGVIEGADRPAKLGAEGRQKPCNARPRRAHRYEMLRCGSLHESTPYA